MNLDFDDDSNYLYNVLSQAIFEKNMEKKLEVIDIIINSLDDKMKESVDSEDFQEFLHELFDDENFMRQLSFTSMIKENVETSIEYHGQDYLTNNGYNFNLEFEKKLGIIKKRINKFLGLLLKELNKGQELEL